MYDVGLTFGIANRQEILREVNKIFSDKRLSIAAPNVRTVTQPLGRIRGELGEFEKSLEASNARVIAFGLSAGAIYSVSAALKATVKSAIDVEKKLNEIAVIMGRSDQGVADFGNQLFDIASKMGTSFDAASKAALELSRQGLGLQDTLKRTSDALLLARMSGMDAEDSVSAITAAINSFNNTVIDSTRLVNQMAAVDMKFAISSSDLANAMKRVGSTASDVGISIEQLIALITSAQQTTQRGGAIIGNALKSIFTRMERPKVLEQLEAVGVQIKEINGATRPTVSVLADLARVYDSLSEAQRSHISELVGGVYQMNVLKAVLKDTGKGFSFYNQALETAVNATDEAQQRSEELNTTLSSKLVRTMNTLTKVGGAFGNLTFAPAIDKLLNTLNTVTNLDFGSKIGSAFLAGVGKMVSGPGITMITLIFVQLAKKMAVFVRDALSQVSGLGKSRANNLELEKQISFWLNKEKDLMMGIASGSISVNQAQARFIEYLKTQTVLLKGVEVVSKEIARALSMIGATGAVRGAPFGIALPGAKFKAAGYIPNLVEKKAFGGALLDTALSSNKFKSVGHIPEMVEKMGALAGGYQPGHVKQMVLEGKSIVYNDKEDIVPVRKILPGAKTDSAFIIPPKGSDARRNYDKRLVSKGINPEVFHSSGFVPSLAIIPKKLITPQELGLKKHIRINEAPTPEEFLEKPHTRYFSAEPKTMIAFLAGKKYHLHGLKPEQAAMLQEELKNEYETMVNKMTQKLFGITGFNQFSIGKGSTSFGPMKGYFFEDVMHTALGTSGSKGSKDIPAGTKTLNEEKVLSAFSGTQLLKPGIIGTEGAEFKVSKRASSKGIRSGQAASGTMQDFFLKKGIIWSGKGSLKQERRVAAELLYKEGKEALTPMGSRQVLKAINDKYLALKGQGFFNKPSFSGFLPNLASRKFHKAVGIPPVIIRELESLRGINLPLISSSHAKSALWDDLARYPSSRLSPLPRTLSINPEDVFEIEHEIGRKGFGTTAITKLVIRKKGAPGKLDQVISVIPEGVDEGYITTVWHNDPQDLHQTLNAKKYDIAAKGFIPNLTSMHEGRFPKDIIKTLIKNRVRFFPSYSGELKNTINRPGISPTDKHWKPETGLIVPILRKDLFKGITSIEREGYFAKPYYRERFKREMEMSENEWFDMPWEKRKRSKFKTIEIFNIPFGTGAEKQWGANGFIPNLANINLMRRAFNSAHKLPNAKSVISKLREGTGLSDKAFQKVAGKLGVSLGEPKFTDVLGLKSLGVSDALKIQELARKQYGENTYVDVNVGAENKLINLLKQRRGVNFQNFDELQKAMEGQIKVSSSALGFVPNLARQLGEGQYGKFYDLEKRFRGIPIGKKVFRQTSNVENDIAQEFIGAKTAEQIKMPLGYFPRVIGSLDRSIKRGSIGKEVVEGVTPYDLLYESGLFPSQQLDAGRFIEELQSQISKQAFEKGVSLGDFVGHTKNTIINDKAEKILLKLAKNPPSIKEKLFDKINKEEETIARITKAISKQGGKFSVVDAGLIEFNQTKLQEAGLKIFNSGFIPNLSFEDMPDVDKILSKLTEQQKVVLQERSEGQTLREIGEKYNVSRNRIRAIESKGILSFIKKWRTAGGPTHPPYDKFKGKFKVAAGFIPNLTIPRDWEGVDEDLGAPLRSSSRGFNYYPHSTPRVEELSEEIVEELAFGKKGSYGLAHSYAYFKPESKTLDIEGIYREKGDVNPWVPLRKFITERSSEIATINAGQIVGPRIPKVLQHFISRATKMQPGLKGTLVKGFIKPKELLKDAKEALQKKKISPKDFKQMVAGMKFLGIRGQTFHQEKEFDFEKLLFKGHIPNLALSLSTGKMLLKKAKEWGIVIERPTLHDEKEPFYHHGLDRAVIPKGTKLDVIAHELGHGFSGLNIFDMPSPIKREALANQKIMGLLKGEELDFFKQSRLEPFKTYKLSSLLTSVLDSTSRNKPERDFWVDKLYKKAGSNISGLSSEMAKGTRLAQSEILALLVKKEGIEKVKTIIQNIPPREKQDLKTRYFNKGFIPNLAIKLPPVNKMGAELAQKYKLARLEGKNRYVQTEGNCFDIACELARRFGYKVPSYSSALGALDKKKGSQVLFNVMKRRGELKPGEISPHQEMLKKSQAQYASILLNEGESLASQHAVFQIAGKQYNYGPAQKQGWSLETFIPLQKRGLASGHMPNLAQISRSQLRELLSSSKIAHITYQSKPKKGETLGKIASYRVQVGGPEGVRQDLIKGSNPPAGYKTWQEFYEKNGIINLYGLREGDPQGKAGFRSFSEMGIKQVRAGGGTYDVVSRGFLPNLARNLYFHGSPNDWNPEEIRPSKESGLISVTRDINHALEYAAPRYANWGSSKPYTGKGFVAGYKLNKNAKIFDARKFESFLPLQKMGLIPKFSSVLSNVPDKFRLPWDNEFGWTELIQKPEYIKAIRSAGYNTIIQRQAETGYYGEAMFSRRVNRKDPRTRENYRVKLPTTETGFSGHEIVQTTREAIDFAGFKLPYMDVSDIEKDLYKLIRPYAKYSKGYVPNLAYIPLLTPLIGRIATNVTHSGGGFGMRALLPARDFIENYGWKKAIKNIIKDKPLYNKDDFAGIEEWNSTSEGGLSEFAFRKMFGLEPRPQFSQKRTKIRQIPGKKSIFAIGGNETLERFSTSVDYGKPNVSTIGPDYFDIKNPNIVRGVRGSFDLGNFDVEMNLATGKRRFSDKWDFALHPYERLNVGGALKEASARILNPEYTKSWLKGVKANINEFRRLSPTEVAPFLKRQSPLSLRSLFSRKGLAGHIHSLSEITHFDPKLRKIYNPEERSGLSSYEDTEITRVMRYLVDKVSSPVTFVGQLKSIPEGERDYVRQEIKYKQADELLRTKERESLFAVNSQRRLKSFMEQLKGNISGRMAVKGFKLPEKKVHVGNLPIQISEKEADAWRKLQFTFENGRTVFSTGFLPNLAIKMVKGLGVQKFITESGSSLSFIPGSKQIDLLHTESKKRGEGTEMFQGLADFAKEKKLPIVTGVLTRQHQNIESFSKLGGDKWKMFKAIYPQMGYREKIPDLQVEGELFLGGRRMKFISMDELKKFVASIPKNQEASWIINSKIKNVKSYFASQGILPNIKPSEITDALQREIDAGYNRSQVKVGFDARIGPLVYNTTEGSPSQAVDLHIKQGKSLSQIKNLGKNKFKGHIPNLADDTAFSNITMGLGLALSQWMMMGRGGGYKGKEIRQTEEEAGLLYQKKTLLEQELKTQGKSTKIQANITSTEVEIEKLLNKKKELEKTQGTWERRRSMAMGAVFVAPLLTGTLEAAVSEKAPALGKGISVFGDAVSLAATAMFAIPGPVGVAVGLAVGGLTAVSRGFRAITDEAPELERKLQGARDNFEQAGSAINNFTQIFDKLSQAYLSQRTSAETIVQLQQQYISSLAEVPEEYRGMVASAATAQDAQEAVGKVLMAEAKKVNQLSLAKTLQEKIDSSRGVLYDTSVFDLKSEIGKREIKTFAGRAIATAEKPQEFAKRVAETDIRSNVDFIQMVKAAQAAGELGEDMANALVRLGERAGGAVGFIDEGAESLDAFARSMQEAAKVTNDSARNLLLVQKVRAEQAKFDALFKRQSEETTKSIIALTDSIYNLASKGIAFANARLTLGDSAKRNLGTSQVNLAEQAVQRLGGGLSENLKGRLEDSFSIGKVQLERGSKFREINTEAINGMVGTIKDALNEARRSAAEIENEVPRNPERERRSIEALQSLGKVRNQIEGQTPEQAFDTLIKFTRDNGDILANRLGDVLNKNEQIVSELIITRATLDQDFREQIRVALEQNKINAQARRREEAKRMLGGAQGFSSPGTYKEGATQLIRGLAALTIKGTEGTKGRGAFDFLKGIKETFGFDLKGQGAVSLREVAIQARGKEMNRIGRRFAEGIESSAFAAPPGSIERYGLMGSAAELREQTSLQKALENARIQIEEEIPLEQMPRDIAKQVTLLTNILNVLEGDTEQAYQEGQKATTQVLNFDTKTIGKEIKTRQAMIGEFETRQKDIRGAREITSQVAALINAETIGTKNQDIIRVLQGFFSQGDLANALETITKSSQDVGRRGKAETLLNTVRTFGQDKLSAIMNSTGQDTARAADSLSSLLSISLSGGSHAVHDKHVENAINKLGGMISQKETKEITSVVGKEGTTNIQASEGKKLVGKTSQAVVTGAITAAALASIFSKNARAAEGALIKWGTGKTQTWFGTEKKGNVKTIPEYFKEFKQTLIERSEKAKSQTSSVEKSPYTKEFIKQNKTLSAQLANQIKEQEDVVNKTAFRERMAFGKAVKAYPIEEREVIHETPEGKKVRTGKNIRGKPFTPPTEKQQALLDESAALTEQVKLGQQKYAELRQQRYDTLIARKEFRRRAQLEGFGIKPDTEKITTKPGFLRRTGELIKTGTTKYGGGAAAFLGYGLGGALPFAGAALAEEKATESRGVKAVGYGAASVGAVGLGAVTGSTTAVLAKDLITKQVGLKTALSRGGIRTAIGKAGLGGPLLAAFYGLEKTRAIAKETSKGEAAQLAGEELMFGEFDANKTRYQPKGFERLLLRVGGNLPLETNPLLGKGQELRQRRTIARENIINKLGALGPKAQPLLEKFGESERAKRIQAGLGEIVGTYNAERARKEDLAAGGGIYTIVKGVTGKNAAEREANVRAREKWKAKIQRDVIGAGLDVGKLDTEEGIKELYRSTSRVPRIERKEIEEKYGQIINRRTALEETKKTYGVDTKTLERYTGPMGNIPQYAAIIRLAESRRGKGGFTHGEQNLFNELSREYIGGDFTGTNFGQSKSWQEMIQKYLQQVRTLAPKRYIPQAGAQPIQMPEIQGPNIQNVNGWSQFSFNKEDRQKELDEARERTTFLGRSVWEKNDARAQYLRSMGPQEQDIFLGKIKTSRDYQLEAMSRMSQPAVQAAYDNFKKQTAQLNNPVLNPAARLPLPVQTTRAGQETGAQARTLEEAVTKLVPDIADRFGQTVGENVAKALGEGGVTGKIEVSLPTLEVSVSGEVTLDGQPITANNNIIALINNAVYKALGRPEPIKQEAGRTR